MKGALIEIEGNWAHFKKPETNNNPLTHDFITKTALIGLIGAVLGVERKDMRPLFPQLSEDTGYGVRIRNPVKKESWAFTLRGAVNLFEKAPKHMEFLKNPSFTVAIGLRNDRSEELFERFIQSVEKNETCYTPVLGLHNCPANLRLVSEGSFEARQGEFETFAFVSNRHTIVVRKQFRIGFERIPTHQNDDFWNDKYVEVVYPSENNSISAKGEYHHYTADKSAWFLV